LRSAGAAQELEELAAAEEEVSHSLELMEEEEEEEEQNGTFLWNQWNVLNFAITETVFRF
jgi:hypothetical protein